MEYIKCDKEGIPSKTTFNTIVKFNFKKSGLFGLPKKISADEARNMTSLDVPGVDDLDFLKFFPNLHTLSVIGDFKEIREIKHLDKLEFLDLTCEAEVLADLTPLLSCKNLKNLQISADIGDIEVDIKSLGQLNQLKTLVLDDMNISDLNWIAGLTELEDLEISALNVVDLSPLTALKKLKRLSVWKCKLNDELSDEKRDKILEMFSYVDEVKI